MHDEDLVEGSIKDRLAVVIVALEEAAPLPQAQLLGAALRLHVRSHRVHLDVDKHNLLAAGARPKAPEGLSFPELLGQQELDARLVVLDGQ